MNKLRVIDLLNRIANEEELPSKIRFNNIEWNRVYGEKNVCYIDEYDNDFFLFFFRSNLDFTLNDEVEIIEDKPFNERVEEIYNRHIDYIYNKENKKMKRLLWCNVEGYSTKAQLLELRENLTLQFNKINEIIDKINKE